MCPPGKQPGYIRRTIKPALGSTQVRKVRGPLLDTLYVRLMRCGNLACTGKPFTEYRNTPDLRPDPADRRLEWEQVADGLRAAIRSGQLTSGDTLPSVPDLARLHGLKPGTVRHAFLTLADEGRSRAGDTAGPWRADPPQSSCERGDGPADPPHSGATGHSDDRAPGKPAGDLRTCQPRRRLFLAPDDRPLSSRAALFGGCW
jgi:hypothetical protein